MSTDSQTIKVVMRAVCASIGDADFAQAAVSLSQLDHLKPTVVCRALKAIELELVRTARLTVNKLHRELLIASRMLNERRAKVRSVLDIVNQHLELVAELSRKLPTIKQLDQYAYIRRWQSSSYRQQHRLRGYRHE